MLLLTKRCSEKYLKKLIGRTNLEDALRRLDTLTREEAWMGIAQNLRATHIVGENVTRVVDDVDQVKRLLSNFISADYRALPILSGNQLRENIHKWLSPPDPSTNHNIASGTDHKKPASWFFQGTLFREWKSTGSLLWIHGKRLPHLFRIRRPPSNTIIVIAGSGKSILWYVGS